MPDRQWYYARNNAQEGPVSETDLLSILSEQKLPPSTLVWAEHLERWTAASDLPELKTLKSQQAWTICPRPWHRLFARLLDNSIYSIPYVTSCGILYMILNSIHKIDRHDAAFIIAMILTLLSPLPFIIESFLLGIFGNTPGKLLFNSQVVTESGEKLTILQALQRTGAVWIRGGTLVACVPVIGFLGFLALGIYQYTQLVSQGIVSWDRNQSLLYQHGRVGGTRIVGLITVGVALFIWFGLLSYFANMFLRDLFR